MKIAVSGKGGTGKTTLSAALAILYANENKKVIAIDADPSPNLALPLGVPIETRRSIIPISKMLDLIEERTGVKPGESYGKMFTLNPQVDDILDKYGILCSNGIRLLVLGKVQSGGSGCFCPENALLRSLLRHLILKKDEVIIMDMEAGVEHLGRSTAESVDVLVIVVEPSLKSIEIADEIKRLAAEIGIKNIVAILNKCNSESQKEKIHDELKQFMIPLIGVIPFNDCIQKADYEGRSPFDNKCDMILKEVGKIKTELDKFFE